jgi:hypothetical protein
MDISTFQLLTASIKNAVLWDVALCSLVHVDRRFRCVYCLYLQGNDAVSTSETSFSIYQTTRPTFQKTDILIMTSS